MWVESLTAIGAVLLFGAAGRRVSLPLTSLLLAAAALLSLLWGAGAWLAEAQGTAWVSLADPRVAYPLVLNAPVPGGLGLLISIALASFASIWLGHKGRARWGWAALLVAVSIAFIVAWWSSPAGPQAVTEAVLARCSGGEAVVAVAYPKLVGPLLPPSIPLFLLPLAGGLLATTPLPRWLVPLGGLVLLGAAALSLALTGEVHPSLSAAVLFALCALSLHDAERDTPVALMAAAALFAASSSLALY